MATNEAVYTGHQGFGFFRKTYFDILAKFAGEAETDMTVASPKEQDRALGWLKQLRDFHSFRNFIDQHPELALSRDEFTHTTPLHLVASRGATIICMPPDIQLADDRADFVRYLVARGADPNARDEAGDTPLHAAVESVVNHLNTVPHQEGVSQPDAMRDILDWLSHPQQRIIQVLLQRGANPNAANLKGQTPVNVAVSRDRGAILYMLWDMGGDITSRRRDGRTPRQTAERRGFTRTMEAIDELLAKTL